MRGINKKGLALVLILTLLLTLAGCSGTEVMSTKPEAEVNQLTIAETTGEPGVTVETPIETIPAETKEVVEVKDTVQETVGVSFIDVGQGDSILIVTPNKEAILVDAGDDKDGAAVISEIEKSGVADLDLVIATHPHADHIGGMQSVIEKYDAKEIMMSSYLATTKTFEELLDTIEMQDKGITKAKVGLVRNIDGVTVEVLGVDSDPKDANNSSIITKVTYGEVSMLLMGDAEEKAEEILLENTPTPTLDVDILKIGHHGSDTSTTEKLLEVTKPKMAVISVGVDNKYNHPASVTIAKLQKAGITSYRTDLMGTVHVELDGLNIVSQVSKRPTSAFTVASRGMSGSRKVAVVEVAAIELHEQVYITEMGTDYHKEGCKKLDGSNITVPLEEAKNLGLNPCKLCYEN